MIAKTEGIAWKAPDGEQVSFGVAAAKTIWTSAGPVPHLMVKFPVLQSDAIEFVASVSHLVLTSVVVSA